MKQLSRAVKTMMLVCLATACDVTVQAGTGGGGGGGSGGGGGTQTDAGSGGGTGNMPWQQCSASMSCPSGQFCFNGLCAIGCNSNNDCAADQFCDTEFDRLCHNKVVTTCPAVACTSNQICAGGFCSTPPPEIVCNPEKVASGDDGCDAKSICVDPYETDAKDPKCRSYPSCSQEKTCPTGIQGALCNDGLIPNKGLICLVGYCKTTANCPTNWACFKVTPNDVVGACSNKMVGAPCSSGADCLSNTCNQLIAGLPGFCG